jgi:NitT/TauT family transport system permease protein
MIAVNSGLGFLIVDARNAGNRYDLVVAGMVLIGFIGLLLDIGMRSLEGIKSLRWGYSED